MPLFFRALDFPNQLTSMPDPVTHLSFGFFVARRFFREYKILFLCSCMVPDIDGLVGLIYIFLFLPDDTPRDEIGRVFELFHPSLPASLFFLPVFVVLVIWAFRLVNRNLVPVSFKKAYLLVFTAISFHLCLDMMMTGNRPFWPLSIEAGLGIIPYSRWGLFVPMGLGVLLVASDLVLEKLGKDKV